MTVVAKISWEYSLIHSSEKSGCTLAINVYQVTFKKEVYKCVK
jgi:hypothetical protein